MGASKTVHFTNKQNEIALEMNNVKNDNSGEEKTYSLEQKTKIIVEESDDQVMKIKKRPNVFRRRF